MKICIPIGAKVYFRDGDDEGDPTEGYAVAEFLQSGELLSLQRPGLTEDAEPLSIDILMSDDIPWFISCLDQEDIQNGTYTFVPGRIITAPIGAPVGAYLFEFDTDNTVITNKKAA